MALGKKRRLRWREDQSNWERLQAKDPKDTLKYRDVYEGQQLDRTRIEAKKSPLSRIILAVIASLLVAMLAYGIASAVQFGYHSLKGDATSTSSVPFTGKDSSGKMTYNVKDPYDWATSTEHIVNDENGHPVMRPTWYAKDENGEPTGPGYATKEEVPEPAWHVESKKEYEAWAQTDEGKKVMADVQAGKDSGGSGLFDPNLGNLLFALIAGLITYAILHPVLMRNLAVQNVQNDTADINQYENDQHIALPEEVMEKFDWFPDAGAHSSVQVSSMISHVALQNKGIKQVAVTDRYKEDVVDEDGYVEFYKGEIIYDDDGEPKQHVEPMFDTKFADALFEASDMIKEFRHSYDARKILYNPDDANRDKLKGYKTVADLINGDWELPYYETQRPAGAYIVDTAPVNTMVLAITRAGKGKCGPVSMVTC